MLSRYLLKKDWEHVRFSDEVHFGFGPPGRLYVTRKPGERYCQDCTQYAEDLKEGDKKKLHAWAAVGVGLGFKSQLVWYDIPTNTNGKMTAKCYRDEILEPIVKLWLQQADFVLEEDRDSSRYPQIWQRHRTRVEALKQPITLL